MLAHSLRYRTSSSGCSPNLRVSGIRRTGKIRRRRCRGPKRPRERVTRSIKEETVYRYFYQNHEERRQRLEVFLHAYKFGKRLKTLKHVPLDFNHALTNAIELTMQDDRAVDITHDEVQRIAHLDLLIGML